MRGHLIYAAALAAAASPALAQDNESKHRALIKAADAFFEALRGEDKTALARTMLAESVIFVHDRRDPDNPKMRIVAAGEHLKNWETSPPGTDEYMRYEAVRVDGSMGHIWGPYVFLLNEKPTHCGINSMSFAMTDKGWRVANTSFTMTSLEECGPLGAPLLEGTGR